MTFRLRFPTLVSHLLTVASASRPTYWGACARCERTTPWITNALRGEYRCAACGHSPAEDGR